LFRFLLSVFSIKNKTLTRSHRQEWGCCQFAVGLQKDLLWKKYVTPRNGGFTKSRVLRHGFGLQ
ncbi:hypothetical protein, partial [Pseudomonas sp. FW306-02-H06B]